MNEKKLIINTAICDTRDVTEEVINSYDSIVINSSAVLVSKESKELFSRYNIQMNTSDVLEISGDVEVMIQNGSFEISPGTKMSKPTMLLVNGSLEIKKNSEEALKTFVSINVNGSVSYPSDIVNQLPPFRVNGSTNSYPADAIKMNSTLIFDKAFILKAKNAKYYVKNKVVIADEALDLASLVKKGTTLITKKALIAENLLEDAIPLFEDETEIIMIPTGYTYVKNNKLDDMLIRQYGEKLYVDGDLIITSDGENALNKLVGLRVSGSILVVSKLADKLLMLDVEYSDLKKIKGQIIEDKGMLSISKNTIDTAHDGITIIDCGFVQINSDISSDEIEQKLQFIDCGAITCNPEQRGAIELVSEDVGHISDKVKLGPDKSYNSTDKSDLYPDNTIVINAASYKM